MTLPAEQEKEIKSFLSFQHKNSTITKQRERSNSLQSRPLAWLEYALERRELKKNLTEHLRELTSLMQYLLTVRDLRGAIF